MGKKRKSQPTHTRSRLLDLLVRTYKRIPNLSSNLRQSASIWSSWDMLCSATASFLVRDWRSYAQRWKEFCDQNGIIWSCDRNDILEIGYGDSRFKADIHTILPDGTVRSFSGCGANKKAAKHEAAQNALEGITDAWKQHIGESLTNFNVIAGHGEVADRIALKCHRLYDQLCRNALYPQSSADVIAAVIQLCTDNGEAQIVAMGSGSKCINGHHLSRIGTAVQDCHAEVVARRAFMRFLYTQAMTVLHDGTNESIFEVPAPGKLLKLKQSICFVLYISKPPCGDATQFTRADRGGCCGPSEDGVCHPYWNPTPRKERKMGVLRKKLESGEGSVVLSSHTGEQSWMKLKFSSSSLSCASSDQRLATMSCSDKILKWNTLGLQGALLSKIMEPVHLSLVVIGDKELFHHGHITRGICCRLSRVRVSDGQLEENHPRLMVVSNAPERAAVTDNARPDVSLHWTLGMNDPEQLNASTGCLTSGRPALICKRKLLESFYSLCRAARIDIAADDPYCAIKATAEEYQRRKEQLYSKLEGRGFGRWVKKPSEVDSFSL